ncbi:MAG: LuxR C-terminal-related transcriptional regulator, partial [Acidimicrobiia bacterium]|nr:LuxR C-terminal-related transcriptional regulator [Acidimicrobiia bacterium]
MTVRYLRTKLRPPQPHPDAIVRQRLVDHLAGSWAPVWLLSAAAGYGKTTVVVQALQTMPEHIAWVSVDRADNDGVRFWTHVATAIVGDGADAEPILESMLDEVDPDHLDATVDDLLAFVEDRNEPVTLVLDDLHEISDTETLNILGRILTRRPASLRIVITARSDPALPIGRLRASGEIVELRAADLAFTPDEATAIFSAFDADTITSIVEHTEGWATGLRMLAVSTADETDGRAALAALDRADRDLGDFLAAEALASLRPALQRFLIETSILDEVCPTVCDAVRGRSGSLALLRELDRSQVFTNLVDPVSDTYRYHRLFRDFLRRRAQELEPEVLAGLHQSAATWFVAAGDPSSVIEHALAAGDDDLALDTIRSHYGDYAQAGQMPTVDRWLAAYGLDRVRHDPELRLAAAWVALNVRRYDEVENWLTVPAAESAAASYTIQADTIRSHLARHEGDLAVAIEAGRLAVAATSGPEATHLDNSIAHAALAQALMLAGDTDEGPAREALDVGETHNNDSSVVIGCACLASIAVGRPDRIDEAERFADRALQYVTNTRLERFHQPVVALLAKSRAASARGRVGEAGDLAHRAERVADESAEPLLLVLARCRASVVAHAGGHSDAARAHLRAANAVMPEDELPPQLAEVLRNTGNEIRFARPAAGAPVELSERELAVLRLLPHGLTRKELGAQLFGSENTIKTYRTSLRHKLGVRGRTTANVDRARELG